MLGFETFRELIYGSFEKSGIHPELQPDNFQSETSSDYGDHELTGLKSELGWTSLENEIKNRWSQDIVAYWFENEDGTKWQSILNIPDKDSKRPYRYIAPKGIGDFPFFTSVPYTIRKIISQRFNIPIGGDPAESIPLEGSFWEWWSEYGYALMPLVITEGGKKALSLLSQGIPAIAIYGCSCGVRETTKTNKKGVAETSIEIKEVLKPFCKPFGRVIVALDNDSQAKKSTYRKTEIAKNRLMVALKNEGCQPSRMVWSGDYKGVDDLIVENSEHFEERFENTLYPYPLDNLQLMELKLLTFFGSRIKFNELKQRVELDGSELQIETVKKWWSNQFNEVQKKEDILEVLVDYARKNSYHPVKEYMTALKLKSLPTVDFNRLSNWIFGTENELFDIYLKKQLIAAIARLFQPGRKVDTVLVLQGSQGIGKSSFLQSLALKPEWFDDSLSASNLSDKDEKMKLHHSWILELAELEGLFRRKEVAQVRALISSSHDKIRLPYCPKITEMARQSTFWASVNSSEFLVDTEGNRRFMVIPVTSIKRLTQDEVDATWLAALTAYESGETWWLNEIEMELQRRENKGFEENDIWQSIIETYLDGRDKVTVTEILQNAIQMDVERYGRRESDRVVKVLKQMGWAKQRDWNRQSINRGGYFWVAPQWHHWHHSQNELECQLECHQNPYPEPVSGNGTIGTTAFLEKNSKLSKKVEIGNGLNPSTDSSGNPSALPTPFSTENAKETNDRCSASGASEKKSPKPLPDNGSSGTTSGTIAKVPVVPVVPENVVKTPKPLPDDGSSGTTSGTIGYGATTNQTDFFEIKRVNLELFRDGNYCLFHSPGNKRTELMVSTDLNSILNRLHDCSILCKKGYKTKVLSSCNHAEIQQWFNGNGAIAQ
jgi:predicted P-loop ATPase